MSAPRLSATSMKWALNSRFTRGSRCGRIKVFRRADDGRLPRIAELSVEERDTLTTPLLPGFSIRLDALFPEQR